MQYYKLIDIDALAPLLKTTPFSSSLLSSGHTVCRNLLIHVTIVFYISVTAM